MREASPFSVATACLVPRASGASVRGASTGFGVGTFDAVKIAHETSAIGSNPSEAWRARAEDVIERVMRFLFLMDPVPLDMVLGCATILLGPAVTTGALRWPLENAAGLTTGR